MSQRIKKTCNGCRALDNRDYYDWVCSLNFKMDDRVPKESCPKPLTNGQLLEAFEGVQE